MEQSTKETQVAQYLREGIISGRFPRGSRLKQTELATALRTSSTPVREALKLLEAEGYVQSNSYRGCTVARFNADAAEELVALRLQLEGQLVRGAVAAATTDAVRELGSILREYAATVSSQDLQASRTLNYRFHWTLYELAGMPLTSHFVQVLWAKYPFDVQARAVGRVDNSVAEHRDVLEGVAAGDVPAAVMAMRVHIERGWTDLKSVLDRGPGYRRERS